MGLTPNQRHDAIDAVRGLALVWMTVFHFSFDLNQFSYIRTDFYDNPFWTLQRSAIVSLFLLCAGIGQALAWRHGQSWARFGRRWLQIAGCALLVTAGWGRWLWLLGAMPWLVYWGSPWLFARWPGLDVFNTPQLNWLGLISRKPVTEDYAPLVPWLGIMWWGQAAGAWLLQRRTSWLQRELPRILRPLAVLGRWSLSYYMLHQPVLIGLLLLAGLLR